MKKLVLFLYVAFAWIVSSQAEEMSLLRIGGETVPMSEFSRYYRQVNHLHKGNAETYFQNFLHFKLKVADAMERGMDTLPDFRRQCESLQMEVLKDFFTDESKLESSCRLWCEKESKRLFFKEWIKMEVLTFRLSQHHTTKQGDEAVRVMNALYETLQSKTGDESGLARFAADSRIVCEEDGSRWTPLNSYVKEIMDTQSSLPKGGLSAPFYSPLGVHVIRLIDRKDGTDMEQQFPFMKARMEQMGLESPALKKDSLTQWMVGNVQLPEEVTLQLKQIHDGLLAVYWDEAFLFKTLSYDLRLLDGFFRANRERYQWEYPHFKGAVIHCTTKKIASKIKKRLKKLPMPLWEEALQRMAAENPDFRTEVESGLFQIGKNKYVDRLAFKCGTFEPLVDLPYTFVMGKRLKNGPEEVKDVLPLVETDYRISKEKELFEGLSSHFQVEINQDVLKTVNSCGNN